MITQLDRATWLANHITQFVNAAFGRRLGVFGPSRSLISACSGAKNDGYKDDEILMAYWAVRCTGETWISARLSESIQPEIILRHSGRVNKITGKPTVRWLDDLIEKVGEIKPAVAEAVLKNFPEEMQVFHSNLLERSGVRIHGRAKSK